MGSELHRFGLDPDEPVSPRQWKALCKFLTAIITNPSLRIGDNNSEINFPAQMAGGKGKESSVITASSGAFYGLYVDDDGDTYLQGGSIIGGNGGSVTIVDEKVIDAGTGISHTAGTVLYIKASCEATVTDGIMLPGCELKSAILTITGGDNHSFTTASKTGYLYYEVGRWNEATFMPSGLGNLIASGCIGNFSLSRI